MTGWAIRAATTADAEPMSALVQALISEWLVPDGHAAATARLQREFDAGMIAARLADGWPHWLAETKVGAGAGTLLGYIALRPPSHLFNCFVRADWHGAGVGRALWQQLFEQVKRQGETAITVNASLRSAGFYQRLGFAAVGQAQCFDGVHFQPMRYLIPERSSNGSSDLPTT